MSDPMIAPSKDINRLLEIMEALRTPETGCPWDLEQNFNTIAPYTIEEAYEVADAIERNDMDDLRLELGDLLLQSVYHAQMAKEAGHFDFGDVVEGVTHKMIRRHPHVFGTEDVTAEQYSAQGMAEGTWDRIKAEEKKETAERRSKMGLAPKDKNNSILDDVPGALPPLMAAVKLQKKASKVGFDWNDVGLVIDKIHEELDEVTEAVKDNNSSQAIEGEIGDLLFAVANLCRHLKIEPETALRSTNTKFRKRFSYIEEKIGTYGKTLETASLEEMDNLWEQSKLE